MKKSYKILLYALPPLVVATLLACAAFPPFLIVSVALLVIYYIILTKVLKLIPADEQETAQHEQQGTYYMPPTVQQPAAPQPVQQAVVPPAPPVAEPPAAQQPEADREKSVAEQPAAVPPEPVAKAESIPPAAQKEVEPVAQWVNQGMLTRQNTRTPNWKIYRTYPCILIRVYYSYTAGRRDERPGPDSADDDDEPEEKCFYRRGSRLRKFPEEFVVIDFETTGFSPIQNEIIEVGMLKVCGIDVVDSYQQLVRPNKPVSARITKITGITNEMLKEAPAASDIMPDVLDFIGDLPLVGHNVSFDVGFLVRNANLYCDGDTAFSSFDTMQCAKRELPFLPDYKLGTVANYFDCQDETAHRALADCHSTLGCFIGLMNYNE